MRTLSTIGMTAFFALIFTFNVIGQFVPERGDTPSLNFSALPMSSAEIPETTVGEIILEGTFQNRVGSAVDITDRWIAVGSGNRSPQGTPTRTGVVHIFERATDGSFSETQMLVPGDLNVSTGFGNSVRFHGDQLFVGASSGNDDRQRIYVFDLNEQNQWEQSSFAENPIDETYTNFGLNFDVDGDYLITGTRNEGGVFVYQNSSTNGLSLLGEITIPNFDGAFGPSVAIVDRLTFAVQSEENIHIVKRQGTGWIELDRIALPEPIESEVRQYRLASSAGRIAFSNMSLQQGVGGVHIYERSGSDDNWTHLQTLTSPDDSRGFGNSLRFDGTKLLIGDSGFDNFKALLYELNIGETLEFTFVTQFKSSQGATSLRLESIEPAIGISDNSVVVGVPRFQGINGEAFYYNFEPDFPLEYSYESPLSGGIAPPAFKWIRTLSISGRGMSFIVSGRNENNESETRFYYDSRPGNTFDQLVTDLQARPGGINYVSLDSDDPMVFVSGTPTNVAEPYKTGLFRGTFQMDQMEEVPVDIPDVGGVSTWADLSGNGQLDLVLSGVKGTSTNFERATYIMFNQGDLEFEKIEIDGISDRTANSVLVADFFNRGHNDIFLIGVNSTSGQRENIYLRNNGNGEFEVEENELTYLGTTIPVDAAMGDLNNNGYLDIVIGGYAFQEQNSLGIYLNNGDGTFGKIPFWNIYLARNFNVTIDIADINNNGWLDIMHTANSDHGKRSETMMLLNSGEGNSFNLSFPMIANPRMGGITAGDLNSDGYNELIAYGVDNRNQRILKAFSNNLPQEPYERPGGVENLRFELDDDGSFIVMWDEATDNITPSNALTYNIRMGTGFERDNIVQSMAFDNGLLRTKGPGNAGYRMQYTVPELPVDAEQLRIQVSAVNHHGLGSTFSSITRDPSDRFLYLENAQTPGSTNNLFPQWVDVNRDGQLNLTLRNRESSDDPFMVTPFELNNGVFQPMESNIEGSYGVWADFYNNGWPDVLSRQPGSGIRLYENRNGDFFPADEATSVSITTISPIDHNLNGKTDLAIATGSVTDATQSRLVINEGDGNLIVSDSTFGRAFNVDAADYNMNGCPDLLYSRFDGVMVYENDCFGNFSIADTLIEYDFQVGNAWWADLTANGYPDAVITVSTDEVGAEEEDLHIMFNQGDGTFENALTMEGFGLISPVMVDITGNGYLDIVINGDPSFSDDISFLLNNGDGTFEFEDDTSFGEYTDGYMAAADVYNRGMADLYTHGRRWEGTNQRWRSGFYRNLLATPYEKSGAPQSLSVSIDDVPTFSWSPGEEGTTPNAGLTYNLRVGTTPGGNDVVSSLALEDGKRLIATRGNVGSAQSITMHGLELESNQTYYWSVQSVNNIYNGSEFASEQSFTTGEITSTDPFSTIPRSVTLSQNYPNPFNPATTIQFGLPAQDRVKLTVYDVTGREVARLIDSNFNAGYHTVSFDASRLASGIYFYRLITGSSVKTRSMTLIK